MKTDSRLILHLQKKNRAANVSSTGYKQEIFNIYHETNRLPTMKYLTILMIFVSTIALAQTGKSSNDISPLLIGEMVPAAQVRAVDKAARQLKGVLSQKPAVMLFYRGGWCPYCNTLPIQR
ncbi:MAG: redoxin domain-containing protein [Cytophagales bacterium]|nr:redoxin domain-containing protein [Cytophagales bacterium]